MAKIDIPSDEKAQFLLEVVEDRKAIEPRLIDLRGKTLLADFFLICAGFNSVHIKAIADRVQEEAEDRRFNKPRVEGEQVGEWVLLDFGDIVLHVMTEEARERYKLEEYWTNPHPKGALPPTPNTAGGISSDANDVSEEEVLFGDFDDDELDEDEEDDAAFFDEADTEVEPIDEDDEEFDDEDAEYAGEIDEEDLEDYVEGSEEQPERDDYDAPEDADATPSLASLSTDTDEGATYKAFDEKKDATVTPDRTDALFAALDNNAQPGRSDSELDDDTPPSAH